MCILNACWNLNRSWPISVIVALIISELPKGLLIPICRIHQNCIVSRSWHPLMHLLGNKKVVKILWNYSIWYNYAIALLRIKEFIINSFVHHNVCKLRWFHVIFFINYFIHSIDFLLCKFLNLRIPYSIPKHNYCFRKTFFIIIIFFQTCFQKVTHSTINFFCSFYY